jgi:hypothetical protein
MKDNGSRILVRRGWMVACTIIPAIAVAACGAKAHYGRKVTIEIDHAEGSLMSNPEIAVGENRLIAVWRSEEYSYDSEIMFSRSRNGGRTWTESGSINAGAFTDDRSEASPAIAIAGETCVVVWESLDAQVPRGPAGMDKDIFFARSESFGNDWTTPVPLNSSMMVDKGEDSSPRIATDGSGYWIAVWDSNETLGGTIGSDHDILFSASIDDGESWSEPAALNSEAYADSDAEDLLPTIAYREGVWVTAWHSSLSRTRFSKERGSGNDHDIYVARSEDGYTWSEQSILTVEGAGLAEFDSQAELERESETEEEIENEADAEIDQEGEGQQDLGATYDMYPEIAAGGDGNWMIVWQFRDRDPGRFSLPKSRGLMFSISLDDGVTWEAPKVLKLASQVQDAEPEGPRVAFHDQVGWRAIWTQDSSDLPSKNEIWTSVFDMSARGWKIPVRLLTKEGEICKGTSPALAATAEGDWLVSWIGPESPKFDKNLASLNFMRMLGDGE